jgi:hypothetical protein
VAVRNRRLNPVRPAALLLTVAVAACADAAGSPQAIPAPRALPAPAAAPSGEPNLFTARDGRVLLNWTEVAAGGHALRFAAWDGTSWTEPRTIATGDDWFVNWADFPSLIELPDGSLAAHWLTRSGAGRYAYDVTISRSFDGGATWTEPLVPHDDGTPTEHGFVALFAHDGALGVIWLDGRNFAGVDSIDGGGHGGHADMTLRFAVIDADGSVRDEAVLDERTCECCQTTAAVTSDGPIIAYRGRTADEIRDINVIRLENGRWTTPARVHADDWEIHGCPVNGPFAVADGRRVAIAWFTAAHDVAAVNVAFSADAGRTFGEPVRVDDGDPLGRVGAVMLDDGSVLVSWLERTSDEAEVRVRHVTAAGRSSSATTVAPTAAARASGFPRMARSGDRVVFAWTVPGADRQVHAAEVALPR